LKVLHFFKRFGPEKHGGVEMFIRHLSNATSALGISNTVLALDKNPVSGFLDQGIRVVQAREDFSIASTGFSLQSVGLLRELATEADVVQYHFPWPFMDVAHFLAGVNKPSLVTYHSDIVRQKVLLQFYKPLMKTFLGNVDAIVATSPNYLKTSPVLQQFRTKTTVIPIGLDEALYPSPNERAVAAWRKRFGGRFFLFVGVLRYYKGLHILLEAAKGTGIPVVIVGAGPVEDSLLRQSAHEQSGNIHFLGAVSEQDKVDLLQACYGVVFPSHLRSEAFGISLLEGAIFGKPLISSEIGTGTSYINVHQQTGLVVPPSDPASLRKAMSLLWSDTSLATALGRAARARYEELFTAEKMGRAYVDLYDRLASTGHVSQSVFGLKR
jgi:rhamnosyl/mannosyltransferase